MIRIQIVVIEIVYQYDIQIQILAKYVYILAWQSAVDELDVVKGEVAMIHHSLLNHALVHHHHYILHFFLVLINFYWHVLLFAYLMLLFSYSTGVKDDKNKRLQFKNQ